MTNRKLRRSRARRQRKASGNTKPRPARSPKPPTGAHKRIWPIVGGIGTVIGLLAAVVTFLPRVDVNVADPVAANDPFSSLVLISNTGYLPLRNVAVQIGVGDISMGRGRDDTEHHLTKKWLSRFYGDWPRSDLSTGKKFTIALNCKKPSVFSYPRNEPKFLA